MSGGQGQGVKVWGVEVRWSVGFSGGRLEINREWFFQETRDRIPFHSIPFQSSPFHVLPNALYFYGKQPRSCPDSQLS